MFWNIDSQIDFVDKDGALHVPGSEEILDKLSLLTKLADSEGITVVNTADWHNDDTFEISHEADMVDTFPAHCMMNTRGAEFSEESKPEEPVIISWEDEKVDWGKVLSSREIVLRKDEFDVFEGNKWAEELVERLDVDEVVVYGVATNYCVDMAVRGLKKKIKNVWVVKDAIKHIEIEGDPEKTFDSWKELGVRLIKFDELKELLDQ